MKTYNFDKVNSEMMYSSLSADRDKKASGTGKGGSCGVTLHQVSEVVVVGDKNGIKLISIETKETTRFELYMDGELLNIFYNKRTAVAMFKDFSA